MENLVERETEVDHALSGSELIRKILLRIKMKVELALSSPKYKTQSSVVASRASHASTEMKRMRDALNVDRGKTAAFTFTPHSPSGHGICYHRRPFVVESVNCHCHRQRLSGVT